jgi:tricorn protease
MYWQSRTNEETTLWNSRFAFRGHLIVLINEHTSSDGEAFARGVSELGLGKLVGKRTWGGGIWLSSDNTLVDGGIASAPEIGTFNDRFGWGLGIEQMGVEPDFEVDNNPRSAFKGEDAQLTQAVSILKDWLDKEPITFPKVKPKKNVVATEKCFK